MYNIYVYTLYTCVNVHTCHVHVYVHVYVYYMYCLNEPYNQKSRKNSFLTQKEWNSDYKYTYIHVYAHSCIQEDTSTSSQWYYLIVCDYSQMNSITTYGNIIAITYPLGHTCTCAYKTSHITHAHTCMSPSGILCPQNYKCVTQGP